MYLGILKRMLPGKTSNTLIYLISATWKYSMPTIYKFCNIFMARYVRAVPMHLQGPIFFILFALNQSSIFLGGPEWSCCQGFGIYLNSQRSDHLPQSLSHTFIWSNRHTVIQPHSGKVIESNCHIVTQS